MKLFALEIYMPIQGRFFPKNPSKYEGNPQNIIFRSAWERTFMEYCDRTSSILKWSSEELSIPYYFVGDQKWHKYFPDFVLEVQTTTGRQVWLVEIKPLRQTQQPRVTASKKQKQLIKETMTYAKNQAKWEAANTFCRSKGWRFIILTEKDLYPSTSPRATIY